MNKISKKGFSLIEIILVIVCISVLVKFATGGKRNYKERAYERVIVSNVRNVEHHLEVDQVVVTSLEKIKEGDFEEMIKLTSKKENKKYIYNRKSLVFSQPKDEGGSRYYLVPDSYQKYNEEILTGDFIVNEKTKRVYYVDNAKIKEENNKEEEKPIEKPKDEPYNVKGLALTWTTSGQGKRYYQLASTNRDLKNDYNGYRKINVHVIEERNYKNTSSDQVKYGYKNLNEVEQLKDKYIYIQGKDRTDNWGTNLGGKREYQNANGKWYTYYFGTVLPISNVKTFLFRDDSYTTQGGTINRVIILNSKNKSDVFDPDAPIIEPEIDEDYSLFK